jgi:hypothetical protein
MKRILVAMFSLMVVTSALAKDKKKPEFAKLSDYDQVAHVLGYEQPFEEPNGTTFSDGSSVSCSNIGNQTYCHEADGVIRSIVIGTSKGELEMQLTPDPGPCCESPTNISIKVEFADPIRDMVLSDPTAKGNAGGSFVFRFEDTHVNLTIAVPVMAKDKKGNVVVIGERTYTAYPCNRNAGFCKVLGK